MTTTSQTFAPGQKLSYNGMKLVVKDYIAEGGEGEVWKVEGEGRQFALKWYLPHIAKPARRERIRMLIDKGSPDPRFIWPLAIIDSSDSSRYGYLMDYREKRFREAGAMLNGGFNPSRRALALASIQVADCFLKLHLSGMCYADIAFGNIAFDPDNGEVRIVDNDNVTIDSAKAVFEIEGTGNFRAPEIYRGQCKPNKQTDKFSLAVLLFSLFALCHPLEGKLISEIPWFDEEKDAKIYGKPAPFIFNPVDDSNRPEHPSFETRWRMLPTYLRKNFEDSFGKFANSPNSRLVEMTWRDDFLRLLDSVIHCEHCNVENFFDRDLLNGGGYTGSCVGCKKNIATPLRLGLTRSHGRRSVALSPGTKLYNIHIGDEETWDFTKPQAEIIANPANRNLLGLKNLSSRPWMAKLPDGQTKAVAPGAVKMIESGMEVQFGRVQGKFAR